MATGFNASSNEIEKLKKRISDLEEEKEDLEDDFNDKLKKEKRKFEERINQLEDELRKSKLQNSDDLESLNNDLKDAKEAVNIKTESLAFVKEILTAQETSSGDMNKSYKLIEDIKGIIVDELVPWSINNIERPQNKEHTDMELFCHYGAYKWAAISRKKWLANKTAIAFVGEFSAGKTSIVNSILSTHLPVSTKATTAIPTYISGGSIEKFQFVSPDNLLKVMRKDTFEKINKEVLDEIEGVSALLKYFVMEYNNRNLQNLSILDTPGFNSNDSEDAQRTIEVINECDALFWVFDVNAGTVNKSSIKLIKENLKKPLYVVINKVDTKSDYDVQQVENLIKRTLSNEGISVQKFIRFSSSDKFVQKYYNELMSTIKSVPRSNNTDDYLVSAMDWANNLVNLCKNDYKDAKRVCKEEDKKVDALQEETITLALNVQHECEEILDLGHYKDHIIRDDMFEFSLDEYESLKEKLNSIYNEAYDLHENFRNYGDTVVRSRINHDSRNKKKANLNRITEIQEKLNKKIKEFKDATIIYSDKNDNTADSYESEATAGNYESNDYYDFDIKSAEIVNTDENNYIINRGISIPHNKSRYIGAILNIFCNKAGTYDIGVKFYSPDGLFANKGEEFSYTTQLQMGLGYNTIQAIGYGSNNAGHWAVGDYHIDYYYNGELMYSAPFRIYDSESDNSDDITITSAEIVNFKNNGHIINKGNRIPHGKTKFIGSILNVLCNKAGTYDIGVKFYSPDGLQVADGEEYSFIQQKKMDCGSNTFMTRGLGDNKQHWAVGDYRIEYYYKGKLMFSVPFCII
ncbi:MAG: dynamin family protein [Bacteroidaceae bacterium]|nr:dynamin family protein [Bacteroidaceae bacterium]MBQ7483902.1 dynamin family protein [Bacteroidaceae bacterium]